MSPAQPVLSAGQLVKRFPGVTALGGVSFALYPGQVHALCGENGAGKSTLIKILAGVHAHGSYEGTLWLDGREVRFGSTRDAEAAGIAVIHQELALVPEMTVAENLCLGNAPTRRGLVDWDAVYANARRVLKAANIAFLLGNRHPNFRMAAIEAQESKTDSFTINSFNIWQVFFRHVVISFVKLSQKGLFRNLYPLLPRCL